MYFQFGTGLQYHAAYTCGQKEIDKIIEKGFDVHPEELKESVYFGEDVKTEELGVMDIPTELIAGIASGQGKAFYSKGFMK